eukprot:gb/GEZN01010592.1/.p1 GENE.gb/GEZN01010592.1/~~gb/GEZN01010592.1/.p1  ORF type:complete len:302 (+),score=29.13 gb/GEZN01010592.1/:81-986(+)
MKDPVGYLRFANHRLRPGVDLLGRVMVAFGPRVQEPQARPVRRIADLGCGTGNLTKKLLLQFPHARVVGIDASPAMLEHANTCLAGYLQEEPKPRAIIKWKQLQDFTPSDLDGEPMDLIFSNAALHWTTRHDKLVPDLVSMLAPGGVLAFQIPDTRHQPSHLLMREAVKEAGITPKQVRMPQCEHDPSFYYKLLQPHCRLVDIWSTEYVQELFPMVDEEDEAKAKSKLPQLHPIASFFGTTGLSPYLGYLGGVDTVESQKLLKAYSEKLHKAYPLVASASHPNKQAVLLHMKRLFVVARRA